MQGRCAQGHIHERDSGEGYTLEPDQQPAELQLLDNTFDEDIVVNIVAKGNAICVKMGKQTANCKDMRRENAISAKQPCLHKYLSMSKWGNTSGTVRKREKTE
jgi:hypothetical protein